jgi:hypothetical protein
MGKQVFLDCRAFVSGADLSGDLNRIEIGEEWEAKKTTNFRSGGAEENIAGLGSVGIEGAGQWEAGNLGLPDDSFWGNRRVIEPWTVGPTGASDLAPGNLMYLTSALRTSMKLGDSVGEVAPWEASAVGSAPLVRGLSVHASGTPRTASGNGTTVDFTAGPTAGQFVYANLHLISIAAGGGSITVAVQSDDNAGFTTPTTRGTFTARTTLGGEALKIANPGSGERYWRVTWTITGGTSPSFLFLVSLGFE